MNPTHSNYDIGSIHWLPARDKVPLENLYATVGIDSGWFDHPVLILWANPLRTEASILLITSFKGTDLLLRHPHDTRVRSLHLPIYPSKAHPDNGSRLFLKNGARLLRNSYVKTENQRTVKTVLLLPTRHGVCTLSKKSYKELVKHVTFHPPVTSQQTTHDTHNMSQDYGEWPDIVSPAVGERVTPPPGGRWVVPVQQALPRQIHQAPRPQPVQQIIPPHQVQQPLAAPHIKHNIFNSPRTPGSQTERTQLLQPVQWVPYSTHQPHTHRISSQAPEESCAGGSVIGIIVLGIFVWVAWRMANS